MCPMQRLLAVVIQKDEIAKFQNMMLPGHAQMKKDAQVE